MSVKLFLLMIALFSFNMSFAQVDLSEQEKIQQQREKNRQEDALRDSVSQPNSKPSDYKITPVQIDPDAQLDVDHSSFGYSIIAVKDNFLSGIKFSGGFTAGFYQEQKLNRNYALIAGVELPIDFELPIQNIKPFAGGGFQIGVQGGIYLDIGLDLRLLRWFKIQTGIHYVLGQNPIGILGTALTW